MCLESLLKIGHVIFSNAFRRLYREKLNGELRQYIATVLHSISVNRTWRVMGQLASTGEASKISA